MRKVKVFHLIKSLNRGGAETLLAEGQRYADRERFDLAYGYFNPALAALAPELAEHGASVTCFGGVNHPSMLARTYRIARTLREQRVDLLHCHLPLAGVVGRLAGRLAGVPVIYTEHNKPEWYRKPTFLLNAWTYGMQERVIAVSGSVAESIATYIRPRVQVTVVRNGIDAEVFRRGVEGGEAIRARFGIEADAVVIGNVAALIPQKRLHDWIEAARLIHERFPGTRYLLVGEGPQEADLRRRVVRSGLSDVVHLCGVQTDVRPYLSAMDIYMMSSAFEGLPVALLEAMAAGCAPVCTAVGGIPEVLVPGVNGLLTRPGHPEELAEQVRLLVAEPARMVEIAHAARATLERDFDIEKMVRTVEAIYLEVLGLDRDRSPDAPLRERPLRV